MAVVGSAYVVVRALTRALKKDISDGVKAAAKAAGPDIDKMSKTVGTRMSAGVKKSTKDIGKAVTPQAKSAGMQIGEAFADAFPTPIRKRLGARIGKVLRAAWKPIRADQGGKDLGNKFIKGFTNTLDRFKIPLPIIAGFFALPAIAGALRILTAYVGAAISLIASLGPAVAGLGAGAAAGIGVLGIAAGAVLLAFKTPTKILKQFSKDLKGLKKEFKPVAVAIQKELLPGLLAAFKQLTTTVPALKAGLAPVGKAVGEVALQLAKVATNQKNMASLNALMKATPGIVKPLGSALGSILSIFLRLAEAGAPLLKQFVEFTAEWLKGKEAALDAAKASGRLDSFFEKAGRVSKQLGRILGSVYRGIAGIFKASYKSGESLLDSIEVMTAKFDKWVNGKYGQTKLQTFFESSRDIVREVNGLIGDVLKSLGKPLATGKTDNILTFVKTLRTDVVPAIEKLAGAASKLAPDLIPLLQSVADLVKEMSESGALGTFFDTLGKIVDLLTDLFRMPIVGDLLAWGFAFGGIAKAINFVLKPIGGLKTILRPLGRLLFGTSKNAGLVAKGFEAIGKTKVGTIFGKLKAGVAKGISGLFKGAGKLIATAFKPVLTAIGRLGGPLAKAIGLMITAAAAKIGWGGLFKGAGPATTTGVGGIGTGISGGIKKLGWATLFKGIGKFIWGPFSAALLVTDIGSIMKPLADGFVAWIRDKLPEPIAKQLGVMWEMVKQTPQFKALTMGSEALLDTIWPDHWPWEDDPPPAPDFSKTTKGFSDAKTAIGGTLAAIGGLFAPMATKIYNSGTALNKATGGALGKIGDAITEKYKPLIEGGKKLAQGLVSGITGLFKGSGKTGINAATKSLFGGVVGIAKATVHPTGSAVRREMDETRRGLAAKRATMNAAAKTATSGVVPTVKQAIAGLKSAGSSGGSSFASGIRGARSAVSAAAAAIRAAANPGTIDLSRTGSIIIGSFVAGLRSRIQDVARAAAAATQAVLDNKGPMSYDKVMLIPAGIAIMNSLIIGMEKGMPGLRKHLQAVSREIPGLINSNGTINVDAVSSGIRRASGASGTMAPVTYNVYNPVAEKTSRSVTRRSTAVARLGAFG